MEANKITNAQMRAIYGMSKKLAITNELLHDLVDGFTNKTSIKELTKKEANKIISYLADKLEPARAKNKDIVYLTTSEQTKKIKSLAQQMNWSLDSVNALSQRMYKQPFRRLRLHQAQGLIEAIKNILERKKQNN